MEALRALAATLARAARDRYPACLMGPPACVLLRAMVAAFLLFSFRRFRFAEVSFAMRSPRFPGHLSDRRLPASALSSCWLSAAHAGRAGICSMSFAAGSARLQLEDALS